MAVGIVALLIMTYGVSALLMRTLWGGLRVAPS